MLRTLKAAGERRRVQDREEGDQAPATPRPCRNGEDEAATFKDRPTALARSSIAFGGAGFDVHVHATASGSTLMPPPPARRAPLRRRARRSWRRPDPAPSGPGWASLRCGGQDAALPPCRRPAITSRMLWLISTTATPVSRMRRTRSSVRAVCTTPRAAVGSSMNTTRLAHIAARQMATLCRWPPDRLAIGASMSFSATLRRPNALALSRRIAALSRKPSRPRSPGRNGFPSHVQVGRRAEVRADRQILVDRLDPERVGIGGRGERHFDAVHEQLRRIGRRIDAGKDFHQRALAGAVVADQGGDLAGAGVEVHAAQRLDVAEPFDDAARLQDRRPAPRDRPCVRRHHHVRAPLRHCCKQGLGPQGR